MPATQIALVGAGFMADTHLTAYRQLPDVRISAVVSPSTASDFVKAHDIDADAFSDLETALEETSADAVDICTPTPTHPDLVRQAVDAGCPVLCEKPLTDSLEDAIALRDDLADTPVPILIGHVLRFFPQYATAKTAIDDGRIGNPGVARARRLSPFPDWAEWYADRDQSGGVFVDLAIHDLDYLRWTFGDVESVFARLTRDDGFEHGTVTLTFENGATGYVEASWGQPATRDLTFEFELAGDDGVIGFDEADPDPVRTYTTDSITTDSPTGVADGYTRQAAHFMNCVTEETEPLVGLDEAVEAVRLSTAARRSADRGEPVALTEVQI